MHRSKGGVLLMHRSNGKVLLICIDLRYLRDIMIFEPPRYSCSPLRRRAAAAGARLRLDAAAVGGAPVAGFLRAVSVVRILRVTNCRGPTADTAWGLQSREQVLGFCSPAFQSAVLQSSTPTALLWLSRAELRLPGCEDAGYRLRPRYLVPLASLWSSTSSGRVSY